MVESKLKSEGRGDLGLLVEIIGILRGAGGCPWDRQQTVKSMSVYLLEEVYELLDAIETGKPEDICEELGDVLFQLVFIAGLFKEKDAFDIRDVIRCNAEKMITRHPHVFGEEKIESVEGVKKRWKALKQQEENKNSRQSVLDSVPANLPALMRAYRISERAAGSGFDWDDLHGVIRKVEEEWAEFKSAVRQNDRAGISMEFGDLLFTLTNVARFVKIHPETSLSEAILKFQKRYRHMEKILSEQDQTLESTSREEIDRLWEIAKEETG